MSQHRRGNEEGEKLELVLGVFHGLLGGRSPRSTVGDGTIFRACWIVRAADTKPPTAVMTKTASDGICGEPVATITAMSAVPALMIKSVTAETIKMAHSVFIAYLKVSVGP